HAVLGRDPFDDDVATPHAASRWRTMRRRRSRSGALSPVGSGGGSGSDGGVGSAGPGGGAAGGGGSLAADSGTYCICTRGSSPPSTGSSPAWARTSLIDCQPALSAVW